MSTSGVTTWQMTQSEIVAAALRKLVIIGDGVDPTTTQLSSGVQALNAMLKTFQTKGMPLWVITEYSMLMTAVRNYNIGVGQTLDTPAPLKITQAILKDNLGLTSRPINIYTHYDYNLLPKDDSNGSPVNLMYEPLNQTGTVHIWPTPDTYNITNCEIQLTYQRPVDDMVNDTDTLDFPQFWSEAVIYGLAWRLSPEYGTPLNDRKVLAQEAQLFLDEALSFGTEEGSLFIQPTWQRK